MTEIDQLNPQHRQAEAIVRRALQEDMGEGDLTSRPIIPADLTGKGVVVAKEEGLVAGLTIAKMVYELIDPDTRFSSQYRDGDEVRRGETLAEIRGRVRTLLGGERVALNFMQRMSGIATATRSYVQAVAHTTATILDTRKTAPGLRPLDKWSVLCGGGQNHRYALDDACLIKENHIKAAGSITEAFQRLKGNLSKGQWVEIEVKNLAELREAAGLSCDRILLDNMSIQELGDAVAMVSGRIPLEASGNVTLDNVTAIAETGVDFISVGSLTHSVQALDISFILTQINLKS